MAKPESADATDSLSCGLIGESLIAVPDVVESTLAAVLESRLAACQVAHLTSEATACAEAVKLAFETLRATPAATE